MATSSNAPDIAKRLLRALAQGGARDGNELKNLPPDGIIHLPGVSAADIQAAINYAEQQAWCTRLTAAMILSVSAIQVKGLGLLMAAGRVSSRAAGVVGARCG